VVWGWGDQVAYDAGVRFLGVSGLSQIKEAARYLPDDVQWVMMGGLNNKNAKRAPSVKGLR
jgi:hypothetical protein